MEELLAPAVTVTVVPVIEHADEVAVVLCTCAMQACHVADVNVAVHDVPGAHCAAEKVSAEVLALGVIGLDVELRNRM